MLVSDRLELAVKEEDMALVQRLQKELRCLQLLVEDLLELLRLENSLPQDYSDHVPHTLEDLVDSVRNHLAGWACMELMLPREPLG